MISVYPFSLRCQSTFLFRTQSIDMIGSSIAPLPFPLSSGNSAPALPVVFSLLPPEVPLFSSLLISFVVRMTVSPGGVMITSVFTSSVCMAGFIPKYQKLPYNFVVKQHRRIFGTCQKSACARFKRPFPLSPVLVLRLPKRDEWKSNGAFADNVCAFYELHVRFGCFVFLFYHYCLSSSSSSLVLVQMISALFTRISSTSGSSYIFFTVLPSYSAACSGDVGKDSLYAIAAL